MSYSIYQPFERLGEVISGSVRPENLHLCIENSDHSAIYFVDSANNKLLKKLVVATNTVTTIETRTNKSIARAFHDWDNDLIYFVDCDFDDSVSYVWKLDLSDDSVTEITSIPVDVFDIWLYSDELYTSYFGTGGYTLEIGNINPNGDVLQEWDILPPRVNHWEEIDEGTTPDTSTKIYSWIYILAFFVSFSPISDSSRRFVNYSVGFVLFFIIQMFYMAIIQKDIFTPFVALKDFASAIPYIIKPFADTGSKLLEGKESLTNLTTSV